MLYVPVRIRQNLSSPSIPGSPIHAHDLKYLHSPCTFWRIFLHIVALTPGKWSFDSACLQSVIERVLLSNGSAHFGSESLRHSQHFIARPETINKINFKCSSSYRILMLKKIIFAFVQKQSCVIPLSTANTSKIPLTIRR